MSIKFWAYFFLVLGISATHISGQLVLRLVGGNDATEGRVEIQLNGDWGTICDDFWHIEDAEVVCRMRGFQGASEAPGGARFGEGTGPIHVHNVACTGDEQTIFECEHNGYGVHCAHSEDAGVVCIAPLSTGAVRLVGGNNAAEGRVEILFDGSWGTICDDDWDINDAKVVCGMLGFEGASGTLGVAQSGQGTDPILLSNVACTGAEQSIYECGHAGFGVSYQCDHSQDAGVVCIAPAESDSSSSESDSSSSESDSSSSESDSSSAEESDSSSSESESSSSEESAESAASAESA